MTQAKKTVLALATLACFASTALYAEPVEFNPSWYFAPSLNRFSPDARFGVDKDDTGVGLRFGKPVSADWDIQFGTSYARTSNDTSRYQQNLLGVDALYMFSRKSFRPFLLIGGGVEYDKQNGPMGARSHTSPYLNLGAGAQFVLDDQWSFQADYRRVHGYMNDAFDFARSHNSYISLGFNYAFEKSPVRRVAAAPTPPAPTPYIAPTPTPTPTPPPPAPSAPAPRFEKFSVSATELFEFNRSEVRAPQPKLDEISTVLNQQRDIGNVQIVGHADRIGSPEYNQALSQRRAEAVKAYIVNRGVDASRLVASGKGEMEPVVECTDKKRPALIKCLEPNRRVEVEHINIERRVQ